MLPLTGPSTDNANTHGSTRTSAAEPSQPNYANITNEEILDRITEKITLRLTQELGIGKTQHQNSMHSHPHHSGSNAAVTASQMSQMGRAMLEEVESHTCAVCYEFMVPPEHAPYILFPCGHSFCAVCIKTHFVVNHKSTCPYCRKKVESRAVNFGLQAVIESLVAKKDQYLGMKGRDMQKLEGSPTMGDGNSADDYLSASAHDANSPGGATRDLYIARSRSLRMRVSVLGNELSDCMKEKESMTKSKEACQVVINHLTAEENSLQSQIAALQEQLTLTQTHCVQQEEKLQGFEQKLHENEVKTNLLMRTLDPLREELSKAQLLLESLEASP